VGTFPSDGRPDGCNEKKKEEKENGKMNLAKGGLGASAMIVYQTQLKAGQMQC